MRRLGRLDGDEGYQRYPYGIAGKHYDLQAELQRERRHVRTSQYDGGGECRRGGCQRHVRIGERHDGIVSAFGQPLLCRYVVVRGGLGPVDMELRRFQRRHHRELHCVALCANTNTNTNPTPGPVSGNCGMQLGGTAIFCDTFDTKNPGIPSRTGDLDPNVWGVSRAFGVNLGQSEWNELGFNLASKMRRHEPSCRAPNDVIICNGQFREASR